MLSQPSWLCSAQTHLGFVGCRSRSQRAGWQGRRRAEPQALAAGHRHAACSLPEHPTQKPGESKQDAQFTQTNAAPHVVPAKPCEALTAEHALRPPPWPEQRPPTPTPAKPLASRQLALLRGAEAQRPPYLSLAQQAATRTGRGPGASSLACGYRQSHGPSTSHRESGISQGKGLWLPAHALQKKTRASPGKTWSAHCCKSLLALAALKCFLIPGFRQSLQRGQTTHKAGTEQRKYLPAAPKACLRLGSAPVPTSTLVTRSSRLLHQPLPQHPRGTPGAGDSTHPPPRVSAAHGEPGARAGWARASSSQPLGHHLCHLVGRVHSPAWLRPPLGPRPTPGSRSHQSWQHVGMAGMCLWALRLSLLTKGANPRG